MKNYFAIVLLLLTTLGYSQSTLSGLLKKYNPEAIPYITVEELKQSKNEVILLDTRERNEYNVSHLKNAVFAGYDHFNLDSVKKHIPNKNKQIVVYCSLGVRSEKIGIKLKDAGYTNVKNLYGGIFEWKNQNNTVYSAKGKETENVHAYSKTWSKWLLKGKKIIN